MVALLLIGLTALHISIGVKSLLKDLDLSRRLRIPLRLAVWAIALIIAVAIVGALLN
jgi:succinate dehydrogenase hydrophobic anchor subunit